jgi:signal transduction histidine kinase
MTEVARLGAFTRSHPDMLDAAVAAAVFLVLILVPPLFRPDPTTSGLAVVLTALACAALVVRRRWPLPVLVVTVVMALPAVVTGVGAGLDTFFAPVAVAIYTVAAQTDRRTTVLSTVPTAILLVGAAALFSPDPGFTADRLERLAWVGLAAAVGDAMRSSRAYLAAVTDRAERAERSREEEALRRVAEERLHIARELHDVVAHHIAVVNVQAGVAEHLVGTDPDAAAVAMGHVRRACGTVLDELGGLLRLLRRPDDAAASTEPTPSMAQLDALVETFRASGLDVRSSLTGEVRPLPAIAGLVAYRLLQEALTNAHRHGTGTADIALVYTPHQLTMEVTNPVGRFRAGSSRPGRGSGLGLLGMRERAGAVGGAVQTVTEHDVFRVRAVLPLLAQTS